jgi:hypothetical protein
MVSKAREEMRASNNSNENLHSHASKLLKTDP